MAVAAGREAGRRWSAASFAGTARAGLVPALALLGGLAASSCARSGGVPTSPDAPVILISIDTMRADHLPAYGYTKIATPNLDRFASDAWLFENAYTPCPMTLPAHTTMLTGELPPEHGVRNNIGFVFDGKTHPSLPVFLKEHGYATGAAVSSYVLRYETGLGPLFDYYEDSVGIAPGVESVHYRRSGDKTAAFAERWIAAHDGKPFFFFFHIYEPHLPYDPPEPFRSRYGVTYDAEVATADQVIGGFLDEMKKLGVYDRAIIVLVGDHGEGLGDHGEMQHSILLYREVMHIPMIVKLPHSFGGGRRIATPAQLSDIVPTVLQVLGDRIPKWVSGSSVLGLPAQPTGAPRVIFGETLFPRLQLGWSDLRSVIENDYQYIYGPRPELYDMASDPGEKHDLIASQPAVAARLAAALQHYPQGNEHPAPADEETLRRLAALGYIGGLHDRGTAAVLPNPVDNIQYLQRMQEGWQLAADQHLAQAVAVLRSVVKDNPGMSDVWIKLGELYADAGQDAESEAAYKQALDRSPVFLADIAVALGFVQFQRGELDQAEAAGQRAVVQVPTKAHELLARVALARGDFATAEREAAAAAGSRNPQPSAILVMAEIKLREGKPADALAVVEKAERYATELRLPTVYNLDYLRGDALARLNRPAEAEAAFEREIAAFPQHAQAYATLGVIHFIQGDRAGLDRLMEAMVKADPTPKTFRLAATTYDSIGDKTAAAAYQRRADAAQAKIPE